MNRSKERLACENGFGEKIENIFVGRGCEEKEETRGKKIKEEMRQKEIKELKQMIDQLLKRVTSWHLKIKKGVTWPIEKIIQRRKRQAKMEANEAKVNFVEQSKLQAEIHDILIMFEDEQTSLIVEEHIDVEMNDMVVGNQVVDEIFDKQVEKVVEVVDKVGNEPQDVVDNKVDNDNVADLFANEIYVDFQGYDVGYIWYSNDESEGIDDIVEVYAQEMDLWDMKTTNVVEDSMVKVEEDDEDLVPTPKEEEDRGEIDLQLQIEPPRYENEIFTSLFLDETNGIFSFIHVEVCGYFDTTDVETFWLIEQKENQGIECIDECEHAQDDMMIGRHSSLLVLMISRKTKPWVKMKMQLFVIVGGEDSFLFAGALHFSPSRDLSFFFKGRMVKEHLVAFKPP